MKKHFYHFILLVSLTLFLYQCTCDRMQKNKVIISGTFLYSRGETLYIEQINAYESVLLDSVIIKENGEFNFTIKPEETTFIIVRTTKQNAITLLVEHDEHIQLSGDIRSLPATYKVSGSPGSVLLQELHNNTFQNYMLLDSLAMIWEQKKYAQNKLQVRDSLDLAALKIFEQQKQFVLDFINTNPHSLASIMALYQTFAREKIIDEFTHIPLFELVATELKKHYPNNSHIFELSSRVERNKHILKERKAIQKRMTPGNAFPETSLPDRDGKPVSINDYSGYTRLVYFWSSQCALCRKINAEISKIVKKYEQKNLILYAVSLDFNKELWHHAVEIDKLHGVHVSDLHEWHSPVVKICNVSDIPHLILVDKEGKIVQIDIQIEELEEIIRKTI